MSRAQGLPITTIIIAALGLLVLVVVGAIFGGQIFKFGITANTRMGACLYTGSEFQAWQLNNDQKKDINAYRDARESDKCNDGERPLTGRYLAQLREGYNPREYPPMPCRACCVQGG